MAVGAICFAASYSYFYSRCPHGTALNKQAVLTDSDCQVNPVDCSPSYQNLRYHLEWKGCDGLGGERETFFPGVLLGKVHFLDCAYTDGAFTGFIRQAAVSCPGCGLL